MSTSVAFMEHSLCLLHQLAVCHSLSLAGLHDPALEMVMVLGVCLESYHAVYRRIAPRLQ